MEEDGEETARRRKPIASSDVCCLEIRVILAAASSLMAKFMEEAEVMAVKSALEARSAGGEAEQRRRITCRSSARCAQRLNDAADINR